LLYQAMVHCTGHIGRPRYKAVVLATVLQTSFHFDVLLRLMQYMSEENIGFMQGIPFYIKKRL
jgi:hypothetical protein